MSRFDVDRDFYRVERSLSNVSRQGSLEGVRTLAEGLFEGLGVADPLADAFEVAREAMLQATRGPGLEREIVDEGPGFCVEGLAFPQSQRGQVLDLDQSRQ